nr:putative ribonuclease H-like domain-containing protein [Tanacetum cinerariifolium]
VVGNQTNGIAGSKENLVAGTKASAVDAGKRAPEVDESEASDNGGKNDQVPRSKVARLLQQERQTENINITNSFNNVSSPVNIVGSSFVNAASQTPINAAGPSASTNAFEEHSFERFSPFKNAFSLPHVPIVTPINDTRIFGNAYDDEVLEREVDMNNVDSSYTIPKATKFLKDHPQEQVIGSLEKPIQTRQISKTHEEFRLLSSVYKLRRTNHKDFQNSSTPIESNKPLIKDEEAEDVDVHLYRSMIGSLMYLTTSKLDITFAVCACASDYARVSLDRKSTTGGCQFLGKRLISWHCKKQTVVASSTIESEYVANANCYGQILWIQNQMLDYEFNLMNIKIYIDNESTIYIVKKPVFHSKTKHIEIRHHFIRDSYEKKLIQVIKIHTDKNVADLLTKAFVCGIPLLNGSLTLIRIQEV